MSPQLYAARICQKCVDQPQPDSRRDSYNPNTKHMERRNYDNLITHTNKSKDVIPRARSGAPKSWEGRERES